MKRKRHTEDEAARKFREAESALSAGGTIPQACKKLGISEATFHRWRKRHRGTTQPSSPRGRGDGHRADLMKRVRELEKENKRLKQLVGELTLANAMLKDAKDALEERD